MEMDPQPVVQSRFEYLLMFSQKFQCDGFLMMFDIITILKPSKLKLILVVNSFL